MQGEARATAGFAALALAAGLFSNAACAQTAARPAIDSTEKLGRALFFDLNLSSTRTQGCVSCHSPELAFTDPRELGKVEGAVSLGADGRSLGDRNAPTVSYAGFAPIFHRGADGEPVGGFFWDGRAATLAEQAGGPPLNPVEMAMPDKASVVARLKENAAYAEAFKNLFGDAILDDVELAYAAMTKAIAAYELTGEVSPFDSKYDRSLRGKATLSDEEARGRDLFFSRERASCSECHLSNAAAGKEVFSNFNYYNLGVPPNRTVRGLNGVKPGGVDKGLSANPAISSVSQDGKFKVPTLRNVAITGPYMHNGVFKELRTVLLFHQRLSDKGGALETNPETGAAWDAPEIPANLAERLRDAPSLTDGDIDALIAFLKTLTDERYERLLGR